MNEGAVRTAVGRAANGRCLKDRLVVLSDPYWSLLACAAGVPVLQWQESRCQRAFDGVIELLIPRFMSHFMVPGMHFGLWP